MRLLYACLCVLLISWAAFGQAPKYTVQDKSSRFTVVNKTSSGVGTGCTCKGYCPCHLNDVCGCGGLQGSSGVITQQTPVTVCQNGVCGVVSPQSQFSSCANGSCSGGTCSGPVSSGGWYPGKFLGRRR